MKKRHAVLIILGVVSVCVVTLGPLFFWWTKVHIAQVRQAGEARWSAIGRPMPEFEKRLQRVNENDSLQALTRELAPFGIRSFYKPREGERDPNTIDIPNEIFDVLDPRSLGASDQVDFAARDFSYLESHAGDLHRLYQGILKREPAVWNFVPQDGMTLRVASFLAARKISQLICVDALHKLEQGDEKGAADAIAAGLKMTSNIGEQPILISQMIRGAIEALFAPAIARLPEGSGSFKQLVSEVETRREKWRAAAQTETCAVTQVVDYLGLKPEEFRSAYENKSLFGKLQLSLVHSLVENDCGFFVAGVAEQVRISEQVANLAVSDLGVKEMRAASGRHAPALTITSQLAPFSEAFRPRWDRSWIRVNAALLLREQAEQIRAARAQLRAGKSGNLGEADSVVVPGAKWYVTGDSGTNAVSLRLTPLPAWAIDREAISEDIFLLPLDGTKWWKFRPARAESHPEPVAAH
jgi:hypothetical protein